MNASGKRCAGPADTPGRQAHFACRRSGQLRRVIDRRRSRRRHSEMIRRHDGDRFGDGEQKDAARKRWCVVMRSAAVIVARTAVAMVCIGMGVRHAIHIGGDLPMLERMGELSHRQQRQTGHPKDTEAAPKAHEVHKLSTVIRRSNSFRSAEIMEFRTQESRASSKSLAAKQQKPKKPDYPAQGQSCRAVRSCAQSLAARHSAMRAYSPGAR